MHGVLEHIDRHLDESLELATLADVAHFSSFHFHRLFSAWMGETLGDYLRRRRLEVAALRLVAQPRVPVLNVALSVGFGFRSVRAGVQDALWLHGHDMAPSRSQATRRTAVRSSAVDPTEAE